MLELDPSLNSPRVRELFKTLVENQSNLNRTAYSESWLEKGRSREFNYLLAASQEVAEFITSYWLPWWSKAERDMANCRIELVDALHFILSEAIIQFGDEAAEELSNMYDASAYMYELIKDSLPEDRSRDVIDFARGLQACLNEDVYTDGPLDVHALFMVCLAIDFDIEKLAALYMGKSTLNRFRQDNGYRQGTYKKKWDGVREDNYFMSEWIATCISPPSPEQVYAWLDAQYKYYDHA